MATTARQHGGKALEKQVLKLYAEGWHLSNIAAIAQCAVGVAKEILRDNKKDITGIED